MQSHAEREERPMSIVFQSFDLQGLHLRNRIIMAPMTRSRVGPGDTPTAMNAEYYAQRASSGLIISEAIVVSQRARGYLFTPGLYTEDQVVGWRLVTEAVHRKGGQIFAQLWHDTCLFSPTAMPPWARPTNTSRISIHSRSLNRGSRARSP